MDTALVPATAKKDRQPGKFSPSRCGKQKPLADRIFTNGEVAEMCGVAPRTTSKWIDAGRLKGFRIPGSNDRRVYGDALVEFLRSNDMRIPEQLRELDTAVVFGLSGFSVPEGVTVAADSMALGSIVAEGRVAVAVIGDEEGVPVAITAAKFCRAKNPDTRVFFVVSPDVSPDQITAAGFAPGDVIARHDALQRLPMLRGSEPQI